MPRAPFTLYKYTPPTMKYVTMPASALRGEEGEERGREGGVSREGGKE